MNLFRFRDRVGVLDDRSQLFLTTVARLGGYVTPEQAQLLGIRNSAQGPRPVELISLQRKNYRQLRSPTAKKFR